MALVWAGIGFLAGILLMHWLAAARIAAKLPAGPAPKAPPDRLSAASIGQARAKPRSSRRMPFGVCYYAPQRLSISRRTRRA
jgi:hypothetical protein